MSRSLAEERDRIKRQIEELEETLGAAPGDLDLLSSDASSDDGSDDGSDDEIQLVEPSHQVSTGLVAQRDQIQQEIEELQTALVSQNAICLSDDDSSDSGESAGEVDIPETEEGCLQVNLVYQQVLLDLLNKLEQLLNQNTHAQKELLFQMAGPTRDTSRDPNRLPTSYQQPAKMYLGRFLKPYFKDKLTGLGPPANVETKDRTNKLTTSIDDKRLQMKRWEGWQKTLLINSVSKDFLKRQIQPKLSKVDYLSQKMYSARTEEDKETLKEQIEQLEKDIQLLRSQKEEELIGDRYDEHDWQKISNIDFEGTREAEDLRRFWQNFLHPSVNKSSWTPEEIKRLEELSEEHGERDWESIAEELGTDRTAFMCFQTYQRYVSKTLKRSSWSTKEDALLRELVEKMRIGNFIPYTQMSYFMEGHDPGQLMYRWAQVLDPSLRKGHWSKEEDKALLRAVARLGERNWCKIRLEVPGRSDGACRDRYNDCLKAGIKRGAFDIHERELLLQLVKKHGVGRWARIAAEIPNRFDAQCLREWRKFVRNEAKRPSVKNLNASLHSETHVTKDEEEEEELVENPEEEEEENENEEEENEEEENEEQVVYMDSDDEKMKDIVKEEKKLEREEEEREQKKFLLLLGEEEEEEEEVEKKKAKAKPEGAPEEAPPGPGTTKCHTQKTQEANTLVYQVVERPHFGPVPRLESAVRSTLADASGRLLNTVVCLQPRALSRGKWHSPLAVLQVSESELYSFLLGRSTYMHSGRGGGGRSVRQRRTRGGKKRVLLSHMNNVPMDSRLMAVVTPWIGNLLVVPEPTWDRETGAYALRQRTQAVSLGSTPFFLLLLQVLNVDALGCKDVIETRQGKAQRLPPPPKLRSHKPRPNSVQALLNQKHKKAQELKEVQQILPQLRHVQPTQPLLPQAQTPRSPQSQWMLIPQVTPPSPRMPPNLRPHNGPGAPPNRYPIMHPVIPPQMAPLRLPHPTMFFPTHQPQPPSGFPPHLLQPVLRQQSTGAALPCITTVRSPGGALRPVQTPSLSPSTAARPAEPAAPSTPALAPPTSAAPGPTDIRGVKRDRAEEPSPGLSANQSSAGESQEAKRVRRMTVKAKVLEEVAQAKTEAKTSLQTQKKIGQAGPPALPDGFQLTPGQSMWLMTPNGLVSLVGELPQGLKIALPPRHQGPTPPMNVFLQPLALRPGMLPTNTHHQSSSTNCQQSTNSTSTAPPSVSATIQPLSVYPIIQPPSVSSAVQPPSVKPTILSPSVCPTIQPPSVYPIIQPPSVSSAVQPPSVSSAIQPPSVKPTILSPSVCPTIQPPSVSPAIQPPLSTTIQLPSVSMAIHPPSLSTIQQNSVFTSVRPQCVIASNQPPPTPSFVPVIPAPLSLHHQGFQLPPLPQCTQVPARSAWLPARTLSVATPCESAARAPRHPLRREALQFDPALMFHEPGGEVQCWLSGGGGVAAPGLGVTLPYLPPFVSSLDTLCALLASKECLRKTAFRLLPPDDLDPTPNPGPDHQYSQGCSVPDPRCETTAEAKVAEVRKLVAKHCAVNPAYQMLKARFLSCFTVPALLATINPIKDKEVLKTASAATENTTLLQEGEGAPATHFTGINTQRPLETQDSSQDSSQDTSQDSSQESSQDQDSSDINSTNKQISDTSTAGQAS